jgi:hypothetical protein
MFDISWLMMLFFLEYIYAGVLYSTLIMYLVSRKNKLL